MRTAGGQPIDDGAGKPVHIWARHDDAGREFAYNTGAERALAVAPKHGWTVVAAA